MENITAVTNTQLTSGEQSLVNNSDQQLERLNYWVKVNAADDAERRLYRRENHEYEASLIRRPLTPKDAYGQLGLLLGVVPPAAIFYKMFSEFIRPDELGTAVGFAALFIMMNVICALVGRGMGRSLSKIAFDSGRVSWSAMLLAMPFIGLTWGMITGFLGGMIFFGLGAVGGMFIAAPVGAIAFTLFAILHRLLERGSLIDRRHFLPIAYGISLAMAAFFLGI